MPPEFVDGKFAAPADAPAPAPAPNPDADAPAPAPAPNPDDWRAQYADGDEKLLKQLERFTDQKALAKNWRDQSLLIRQDKLAKPLGKDATPNQIAEWRAERGIPDKPEDYDTKMPDGLVFGESDKAGVDAFLKAMHGTNASKDQVKAGLQALAEFRQQEGRALTEQDATERGTTEEALREVWGGNYKRELARIEAMFAGAPTGVRDMLMNARAGSAAIMNKPEVVQWLAGVARELNPTATIVPAGGNKEGAISDEIKQIEDKMFKVDGSNNPEYWGDAKLRDRYSLLLQAKDRK